MLLAADQVKVKSLFAVKTGGFLPFKPQFAANLQGDAGFWLSDKKTGARSMTVRQCFVVNWVILAIFGQTNPQQKIVAGDFFAVTF